MTSCERVLAAAVFAAAIVCAIFLLLITGYCISGLPGRSPFIVLEGVLLFLAPSF